jgi:YjjG family noncanonical pyrimidine nucleotidase
MRYTTILFDLDHTLLDSDASEVAAFDMTLRAAGVEDPARYFAPFEAINAVLWAAVEREELSPNEVRRLRFEQLVTATGLDADPVALADLYVAGLGANGDLYPGAVELLEAIAAHATLALVTNGIGEVQRARIARTGIEQYFDAIVISGEVGASKPGTAIFDLTFGLLGNPDRSTALMVGDNESSDIEGGIRYGIDTCWFAPDDAVASLAHAHRISDLPALMPIVSGG